MRAPRARALVTAALALVLAVTVTAAPAGAETDRQRKHRIDAQIAQLRAGLGETSTQLADAVLALRRAQLELPAAEQAVQQAQAALDRARARDQALAARLAVAEAEEQKASHHLGQVVTQIDSEQQSIGALANAAYRQGGMGQLAVAMQADSPDDFANRLVAVETVVRSGDQSVARLDVARADLRSLQAVLAAKRAAVAEMRAQAHQAVLERQQRAAQAQAAHDAVRQLIARRAAAAAAVQREKAAESARLADAQAESRRLAAEIAAQAARLAQQPSSRGAGRGLVPSGSLLFPAAGPVSQYAGYRVHPVTGNASCHAGIDISAGYGAPIHAADDGVVLAVTSTSWDGNVTVIDHGGGMTTWYAHQSSMAVSAGQTVRRGQVIGYVGSTGLATGPHLHFNVALGGVAYDPMGWFGGSRRTVASLCPNGPAPVL